MVSRRTSSRAHRTVPKPEQSDNASDVSSASDQEARPSKNLRAPRGQKKKVSEVASATGNTSSVSVASSASASEKVCPWHTDPYQHTCLERSGGLGKGRWIDARTACRPQACQKGCQPTFEGTYQTGHSFLDIRDFRVPRARRPRRARSRIARPRSASDLLVAVPAARGSRLVSESPHVPHN